MLTIFIARYLGFGSLGLYGLINAATILIPSTIGLSLMYTISRRAVMQHPKEITRDLIHYFLFIIILYALLFIPAFIYGLESENITLIVIVVFAVFCEHINNDIYSLLLNRSKPFSANILHFIRTTIFILVYIGLAFYFPNLRSLNYLLSGWIIGNFLAFLGFMYIVRDWPWKISKYEIRLKSWVRKEFLENKHNFFNNSIRTGNQYLNHFLLTLMLGIEITGVYVYFMQVLSAMSNLLQTGVIQITRPKLVKAYKEHSERYYEIYKVCLIQTLSFSIIMAVCSLPAMYYLTFYVVDKPLAVEQFPAFFLILSLFVLAMLSQVNVLVFYSQHRDDLLLKMSLMLTPFSVLLSIALIHYYGLWGAVVCPNIMVLITLTYQYKYMKKLINRNGPL